MGGQPVLLLTTTGRRSGRERTTPVQYAEAGDQLVIVASNGGAPTPPAWYLNLLADPHVHVQRGGERLSLRAREATGPERERLWARLTAANRWLGPAEERARRRLPVVVLHQ
jgi:deazaflavin-dependent oxidoreductase (nitroreductase family)